MILMMIGIIILSVIIHNRDILLITVYPLVYLFSGALWAHDKRDIVVSARRNVEKAKNKSKADFDVTLMVSNNGNKALCLSFRDCNDGNIQLTDGSTCLCSCVHPGQEVRLKYTFTAYRGICTWSELPVCILDPLGIFERTVRISAPAVLTIQPHYHRLRSFNPHPWNTVSVPGIIPVGKSGSSTDFFGIREYHSGDPVGKLDWKMTEKHPHKYYIREFEHESNAEIALIVDGRKHLHNEVECIFEKEIELAASLAEMFIRQGNRVGMTVLGGNHPTITPGYGKKQLNRILNGLAAAQTGNCDKTDMIHFLQIRQYSRKAQYFFISPYDYQDLDYYRTLRARGLQIVLITPDTFGFLFADMDSHDNNTPLHISKLERKLNLFYLTQMSVTVVDWDINLSAASLLKKALFSAKVKRRRG